MSTSAPEYLVTIRETKPYDERHKLSKFKARIGRLGASLEKMLSQIAPVAFRMTSAKFEERSARLIAIQSTGSKHATAPQRRLSLL